MLRISILFCLLSVALAAFWKGKVDTDEKFEFIERFGYAQTNPGEFGVLNYTITPTDKDKVTEAHHLKVALYHGGHWDKVYKTDLTCEQKLAIAKVMKIIIFLLFFFFLFVNGFFRRKRFSLCLQI